MSIPKYISRVHNHFFECFTEHNRCIHCFDCIAFAIIFSQKEQLSNPKYIDSYAEIMFYKFLKSTIKKVCLRCGRGISFDQVKRYAEWILSLSSEDRDKLRKMIYAHAEFQHPL